MYNFASFCIYYRDRTDLLLGKELPVLANQMEKSNKIINQFKHIAALQLHNISWQVVLNLLGKGESTTELNGPIVNQDEAVPLWEAFKAQVEYAVKILVDSINIRFPFHSRLVPLPFTSALTNDCIKNGKDLYSGGGRYNNFANLTASGLCTTANSMAAIKKLVFEDKVISMRELLDTLQARRPFCPLPP